MKTDGFVKKPSRPLQNATFRSLRLSAQLALKQNQNFYEFRKYILK